VGYNGAGVCGDRGGGVGGGGVRCEGTRWAQAGRTVAVVARAGAGAAGVCAAHLHWNVSAPAKSSSHETSHSALPQPTC